MCSLFGSSNLCWADSLRSRANAAPLSVELMKRLMKMMAELPLDDRADLAARGIAMIRLLDEEDIGQVDRRATILITMGKVKLPR
jgi:hypothetical protein